MAQYFRENPDYATDLLTELRRSGNLAELDIVVRYATMAFGQDKVLGIEGSELKPSSTQ
ncbi:Unknown protein sequence [Pseudomonas savastanoi pv. phaseolicola]|uniref:transcriptional regulator n=1 Tax=Pseudomonas savastanoi TaxID=29438 RepID=UPI0006CDCB45|nr:transcriptional regulator [Pseudomonas savastanoi]KPB34156.1 Unknown protein sequence [Pseudomonas savastanoi pv. phaseolicola]